MMSLDEYLNRTKHIAKNSDEIRTLINCYKSAREFAVKYKSGNIVINDEHFIDYALAKSLKMI